MSQKKPAPKPVWYKNTYFWIGGILLLVGILGLITGDNTIRDPGQKRESGLGLFYLGAAVVMILNGWMSHRQTELAYQEELEGTNS